jgi:hypothetical protein
MTIDNYDYLHQLHGISCKLGDVFAQTAKLQQHFWSSWKGDILLNLLDDIHECDKNIQNLLLKYHPETLV